MSKIIISSDSLKPVLSKLGLVISEKSVLPTGTSLLLDVKDGVVELTASDVEVTIKERLAAETSGEAFQFVIPYKLLHKIVSLNKSTPLKMEVKGKGILISGENDSYLVRTTEPVENFSFAPALPKRKAIAVEKWIIEKLAIATQTTAGDTGQPKFQNVLFELKKDKSCIASTNGSWYVFSYDLDLKSDNEDEILISKKVIKALQGQENLKLFWNAKHYAFENDQVTVVVTRPTDKYPNFRGVIPQDFTSNLKIDKAAFDNALEKCSITDLKITNIDLEPNKVSLKSSDEVINIDISIELPAEYTGEVKSIKVNSEIFLKLLRQVNYSDVNLAIHDSKRAILLRSDEDANYLGLLMPLM